MREADGLVAALDEHVADGVAAGVAGVVDSAHCAWLWWFAGVMV